MRFRMVVIRFAADTTEQRIEAQAIPRKAREPFDMAEHCKP